MRWNWTRWVGVKLCLVTLWNISLGIWFGSNFIFTFMPYSGEYHFTIRFSIRSTIKTLWDRTICCCCRCWVCRHFLLFVHSNLFLFIASYSRSNLLPSKINMKCFQNTRILKTYVDHCMYVVWRCFAFDPSQWYHGIQNSGSFWCFFIQGWHFHSFKQIFFQYPTKNKKKYLRYIIFKQKNI